MYICMLNIDVCVCTCVQPTVLGDLPACRQTRTPADRHVPTYAHIHTDYDTETTRNILKKDIRRLSNTDDKRNQILWFRRNPHLALACWNLKPAKLWSCFCLSFAWFCAQLTLFAERYASESFFFFNFRHSPARVWEQCFKFYFFRKWGVLTIN